MVQTVHYLDYAAATPIDDRVFSAMQPYFQEKFYNPSSPYAPAVEVRREYEAAKTEIAQAIGATSAELIMTAGATESINLALGSTKEHKLCTVIEHDSVREAIKGGEYDFISVDKHGCVTIEAVKKLVRDDTELVSIALANHEIGTIQPIAKIAQFITEMRRERQQAGNTTPLYLHCDASQGFGLVDIHVGRLGVDYLTLNSAKIYGPKQVGTLWVRPGVPIRSLIRGGGQEAGARSGTENVAGVIGFATAITLAANKRKNEVNRIGLLRDTLQAKLVAAFPSAVVSGHPKHRLANFLHISFPYIDAERIVFILENEGVMVATGSACAANKATRSAVLTAIGLEPSLADGSLRLSLGRHTTEATVEIASTAIIEAVKQEYARVGR